MTKRQRVSQWAVRPLVPEAVYTDREEYLDYLYKAALESIGRRTMSTVLLGQRRMGKTEIFKRVVNRLFFDQQDPADLDKSVVPVYFSFPDTVVDRWDFSLRYVENFIRWYVAFRLGDPGLVTGREVPFEDLKEIAFKQIEMTEGLKGAFNLHGGIKKQVVVIPEEQAVMLPRSVSDRDETTIVMFLDEFQNTRLQQYYFAIGGWMRRAVESPTCPHFVTGLTTNVPSGESPIRGALFGRFMSKPIEALTQYWSAELALRAGVYFHWEVPEEMAPVIADRCGGNPFYIQAVVQQAREQGRVLDSEKQLAHILAVDLSSGFIWGELSDQVNRWIERINTAGITKAVLYLSALEEGDRLDLARIQKEVQKREGVDVPMEEIRDVLIKLSRGDLLEYMEFGGWFRKVRDPILLEFLKIWGRIEVDAVDAAQVRNELITGYRKQKRRFSEYKGYLAEVFMAQVLWAAQDKTLPGHFFHSAEDVSFPRFIFVRHRMRLGSGKGREIDVVGAGGGYNWVCQSKWIKGKPIGVNVVHELLEQSEVAGKDLDAITMTAWLFACEGLTPEAEKLAESEGVLWSDINDFNGLLEQVGLRKLPDL